MTDTPSASETIRFPVAGMSCASCINRITRALRKLDGVDRIRVDLGSETVSVRRVRSVAPDAALATAIAEAGYEADLGAAALVMTPANKRGWLAQLFGR